jgi:hypothetical protein
MRRITQTTAFNLIKALAVRNKLSIIPIKDIVFVPFHAAAVGLI